MSFNKFVKIEKKLKGEKAEIKKQNIKAYNTQIREFNKFVKIEKKLERVEAKIKKQEEDIFKRMKLLEAKENKIKNQALEKQKRLIKQQKLKAFNTQIREFNRSIRKEDLKLKRSQKKVDKYFESLKAQGINLGIELRKEEVKQLLTYSIKFYTL